MIWQRLYNKRSGTDKGTLQQLKNLINQTAVPADPEKNVKSTEDFLNLVLVAHIVVAAQELLEVRQYDSNVHQLSRTVVDTFIELGEGNTKHGRDGIR